MLGSCSIFLAIHRSVYLDKTFRYSVIDISPPQKTWKLKSHQRCRTFLKKVYFSKIQMFFWGLEADRFRSKKIVYMLHVYTYS